MYKAYYEVEDDEFPPDRVVQVSVTKAAEGWVPEVQDVSDFEWVNGRCRVTVDYVGYLDCGPCSSMNDAVSVINDWLDKREHRPWRVVPASIKDWS